MNAVVVAGAWIVFVFVPFYCYFRHLDLHYRQWDEFFDALDEAHRQAYEAEDLDAHDLITRVEARMFRYFNGRHEE